jgi:hypothetical protein
MDNESPRKLIVTLNLLGVLVCAILVIIDLQIKSALIREAKILETQIARYRAETTFGRITDSDGGISSVLRDSGEIDADAAMEVESIPTEVAPPSATPQRRTRNTAKGIQSPDKQV